MSVPKVKPGEERSKPRTRMAPEERREQVLAVAARVFSEKGYRNAAVTDIVEGAGIGRGTFYLYFDSKRDIFLELIERYFSDFELLLSENHRRLDAAVRARGNAVSAWRDNMIRILEYHRDNSHLTSVVYRDALGMDEDFSARVDELSGVARKQFHEQFSLMMRNGLIRRVDLDLVATIVMGSSVYVIMEHVVKGRKIDLERLADEIIEYHTRALMSPGADLPGTRPAPARKASREKAKKGGANDGHQG